MMINLVDPKTNVTKKAKIGFSWTTFFFGFFPAVFREDWKWAAIIFIIEMIATVPTLGFGFSIVGIIFSFFYNRLYIKDLLAKGYVPADEYSKNSLINKNFEIKA
ncbi:DUF2628 domain-containing protein [Companilactobacillus furfuricola]|uniref:DUF2628 domain-containing protein n=1 Tax=Companilactobacillus furfuricola TaxID=1462575 RepID=UPI000F799AE3|nr:DUF2628 domain-containing protein [Companilactobacillus furfuricola]